MYPCSLALVFVRSLTGAYSCVSVQFGSVGELLHTYDEKNRVQSKLMRDISSRLNAGQLVPSRVRKLEGLEAGGKEGLQLLVDHKLSAEKAVVHVSD